MTQSVANNLRAAKALCTPEAWAQGEEVWEPGRFCIRLALDKITYGNDEIKVMQRALDVFSIAEWNDAPERTHADVMNAFNKAIKLAEKNL